MPNERRVLDVNQWWLKGGVRPKECLAAFQPIGASGITQSLQNINGRGSNDAVVGTTPSHTKEYGWEFDGSTTYLTVGSGAVKDAVPLSMICLFNGDAATAAYDLMGVFRDDTAKNEMKIVAAGATSSDPITAVTTAAATSKTATSGRGFSAGTWCVAAGVFATTALRKAYCFSMESRRTFPNHSLAVGDQGSGTTSNTPESLDATYIGCSHDSSAIANVTDGKIAACAFYDIALTDRQVWEIADAMFKLVLMANN